MVYPSYMECLAYIDPGSGSLIFQMLIAGTLGVIAFFRHSIAGIFKKKQKPQGEDDTTDSH